MSITTVWPLYIESAIDQDLTASAPTAKVGLKRIETVIGHSEKGLMACPDGVWPFVHSSDLP
jgi:hypothetical protein